MLAVSHLVNHTHGVEQHPGFFLGILFWLLFCPLLCILRRSLPPRTFESSRAGSFGFFCNIWYWCWCVHGARWCRHLLSINSNDDYCRETTWSFGRLLFVVSVRVLLENVFVRNSVFKSFTGSMHVFKVWLDSSRLETLLTSCCRILRVYVQASCQFPLIYFAICGTRSLFSVYSYLCFRCFRTAFGSLEILCFSLFVSVKLEVLRPYRRSFKSLSWYGPTVRSYYL